MNDIKILWQDFKGAVPSKSSTESSSMVHHPPYSSQVGRPLHMHITQQTPSNEEKIPKVVCTVHHGSLQKKKTQEKLH